MIKNNDYSNYFNNPGFLQFIKKYFYLSKYYISTTRANEVAIGVLVRHEVDW